MFINPDETIEIVKDGLTLVFKKYVTHIQHELFTEVVRDEALKLIPKLPKNAQSSAVPNVSMLSGYLNNFPTHSVKAFAFKAVAVKFILDNQEQNAWETYQKLDQEFGKWTDEEVAKIWQANEIPEKKKKSSKS